MLERRCVGCEGTEQQRIALEAQSLCIHFVCVVNEVLEIPTPEWDDTSTNWCPRSDSNRHWKDFKSSVSAIGLRGPRASSAEVYLMRGFCRN